MTFAEMNRRIAEFKSTNETSFARAHHLARYSTYTPRELATMLQVSLANINAVFKLVESEIDAEFNA